MLKQIIFQLVFLIFLLSIDLSANASAKDKTEVYWALQDKIVNPQRTQKDYGIAVAFLDIQQPNVYLTIRKIIQSSLRKSLDNPEKLDFWGGKKGAIKLDLSGRTNFISFNLPQGLYQITQVDVPHFDLPYKISTDNSDVWRFRVEANKINYVGTMKVSAIRGKKVVDTAWLNQFATHLHELQSIVDKSDIPLPIGLGTGYKDPYFTILMGNVHE